jgi:hypothetical protein
MGSLKYPTLAAAAFAALAATLTPSALGIAAGGQAAAPLRVELEPPRCQDASALADPWLQNELAGAPKVPIVRLTIRGTSNSTVSYQVNVDDAQRNRGTVTPGGQVISEVSLPNGKDARVLVKSGQQVVLDRTVSARC